MSKKMPLGTLMLQSDIWHLQTLPYQNQVVAIFFSCIYGCHFENGRFIQGVENPTYFNQVEKHVILFV